MTTEIVEVPFHGSVIHSALVDGQPVVVVKPSIERMGLDPKTQIDKLKTRSWATTGLRPLVAADGRERDMVTLDLDGWAMLLANINENRVRPELKQLVIAYQRESAKVLRRYWGEGAVINPRVTEEQLPGVVNNALTDYRSARETLIAEDEAERRALANISQAQLSLIRAANEYGFVDDEWAKTKAQVVIARGMGETPIIAQADLPLYVEEFMKTKRVPGAKITRFSGAFGKKIMHQAACEGLQVPGKRTQELPDGTIREITAWTKDHLPVFERAWQASYANDARLV